MKARTLVILILLLLVAVLWGVVEARGRSEAQATADSLTTVAHQKDRAVDSLTALAESLAGVYRIDTLRLTRWRVRWDSIRVPGATDTIPVEIIVQAADSVILACTAALQTCEQRVAVATARGDSAQAAARAYAAAAAQWKKIARGPLIRLALEGTVTPALDWQAAGDVTFGRGRLKALARFDVGPGAETCDFQPNTEAYTCTTPTDATVRFGVRWGF